MLRDQAQLQQLPFRAPARIILHRQRDELEQDKQAEQADAEQRQLLSKRRRHARADERHQDAEIRRDPRDRHNRQPELQRRISRLVLQRVAGFVSRHAQRGERTPAKTLRRQAKPAAQWIVVIGELPTHLFNRHLVQSSAIQNPTRRLRA